MPDPFPATVFFDLGDTLIFTAFPARYTALSPLLELRAANATVNSVLPVSGSNVAVTAWKLASSAVDIAAQANAIAGFLADNENSSGRYSHGGRFTAFVHQGGMEDEGGTTSSTGPLRHETFHSWWARDLKPASQPDAWFDEAWTIYNDNGAAGVLPFNFADPASELCTRNPWVRVTHSAAYGAGERVWKGIAALQASLLVEKRTLPTKLQATARVLPTRVISPADVAPHGQLDCACPAIHDPLVAGRTAEVALAAPLTSQLPERVAEAFPGALEIAFAKGKQARLPSCCAPPSRSASGCGSACRRTPNGARALPSTWCSERTGKSWAASHSGSR
ncbi:MAG: hypothetical protein ACREXR_00350 [Gammaproteobacteria bacterium]